MSDKLKLNLLSAGVIFLSLIIISIMLVLLILSIGKEVDTISKAYVLQDYVTDKNLSLPIPQEFKDDYIVINQAYDTKENAIYLREFSKPIEEYKEFIQRNFMYDINSYDCKYWSYVHTLYWKMNYEKYDWNIEYIDTKNHIFVMISNSSGYAILDQDNINCYGGFC